MLFAVILPLIVFTDLYIEFYLFIFIVLFSNLVSFFIFVSINFPCSNTSFLFNFLFSALLFCQCICERINMYLKNIAVCFLTN